jgi:hypothetical protein
VEVTRVRSLTVAWVRGARWGGGRCAGAGASCGRVGGGGQTLLGTATLFSRPVPSFTSGLLAPWKSVPPETARP